MNEVADLKKTPLHDLHVAAGARMSPFAGFSMPVQYSGIVEEHLAVRKAAGLFDVSHMGEVIVSGPEAVPFLQWLVVSDVASMNDGRALYTTMCLPDGGIVDDLLVYRLSHDRYMLVINAGNASKDVAWITAQAEDFDVECEDVSEITALLALQGPATAAILGKVAPEIRLDEIRYYHFALDVEIAGAKNLILSRTGYTGEFGVEIYCAPSQAAELWDTLLEAGRIDGLVPAGLGARDTLRLEAGMALYGNDLDETVNPIEAGLERLVRFEKDDFLGRDALLAVKRDGPRRRLVGFVMDERGIPRHGYELVYGGAVVGTVTSGSQSPILQKGIGLGYVSDEPYLTAVNAPIGVLVRGRALAAHVARPPFHKN
jgi:aminomethyltransferase